jgi:hypothetical protein
VKLVVNHRANKFPQFMERQRLLLFSQESITGLHPTPEEINL